MAGNKQTKYSELEENLRLDIENGIYKPLESIPSDNELMKKYRLSKSTVTKSLTNLVSRGYIYREQGKGSFVCPNIKSSTNLSLWIASEEETERKYWMELVNDFNGLNKDFKLEPSFLSYSKIAVRDVLYKAFASGNAPDLLTIDGPDVPYWAYMKAIRPLDDYMNDNLRNKVLPSVLRQGTWSDQLFQLGYHESTMCIVYNQEVFAKLGIKAPAIIEDAWTWNQFTDICKIIKEETDLIPLAMDSGKGISERQGEWCTYSGMVFLWQNGAAPFDTDGTRTTGYLNSNESIEAMAWLGELYYKHKYTHVNPIENAFPQKSAMSLVVQTSFFDLSNHFPNLNIGVLPLPYNRFKASPHGGWGLTITSQSKNPDKAWEFIEFFFSLENQLKFVKAVGMPVFKQIYDIYADLNKHNPSMSIIYDQLEKTAKTRPITPAYPYFSRVFAHAYVDIASGKNVQKTLDRAAQEIDRSLEIHGVFSSDF